MVDRILARPMKYVGWMILIVGCFALGRMLYDPLSPLLVEGPDPDGENRPPRTLTEWFGSTYRQLEVSLELETVGDDEIPEEVILTKPAVVAAGDQSNRTKLLSGDRVRVLGLEGGKLRISPTGGPLEGVVPVTGTDFAKRVIRSRAERIFRNEPAGGQPAPPPTGTVAEPDGGTIAPGPEPEETVTAPEAAPDDEPSAAMTDPVEGIPEPEPEPAPTPAPEPLPASTGALTDGQIVELMKASVEAGDVEEFDVSQVQGWQAGEEEQIDGETYQTGLAAYKMETIFGIKPVQAKALIKEGRVVKWVYAETGMEIR